MKPNFAYYILPFLMMCTLAVHAQHSKKNKDAIKDSVNAAKDSILEKKIANRDFSFEADRAVPTNGSTQQLNNFNIFKVSGDTVIVQLPYFGDAYSPSAVSDPAHVSLNLSSKILSYTFDRRDKGGWDILIKPTDQLDMQSFFLVIFEDGSVYLNVACTGRNSISYYGYLDEKTDQ